MMYMSGASWIISWGEVWGHLRVVGALMQSVVNGLDVGKNKARI